MPELDALLLRNHRITSFQSYLEKLTAEEISGLVPKVEPLSLQKAAQAWDQLRADLLAVAEAHRQAVERLAAEEQWWGPAAEAAIATIGIVSVWLYRTVHAARSTYESLATVTSAYCTMRDQVIPLEAILENRRKVAELRKHLGNSAASAPELDRQYEQFLATNIHALGWYYDQASRAARTMPSTQRARAKRAQ